MKVRVDVPPTALGMGEGLSDGEKDKCTAHRTTGCGEHRSANNSSANRAVLGSEQPDRQHGDSRHLPLSQWRNGALWYNEAVGPTPVISFPQQMD